MSQPNSKEINPQVDTKEQDGPGEGLRYASDPSPDQARELPRLKLPEPNLDDDYDGRCRQTLLLAEEAFAATGSWVVFFREILGVGGVVMQLFPEQEEYRRFTAGPEFATLHEMLAAIRSQDQSKSDAAEPERMITIRIPRSLHESLAEESQACGLSINKLSISKLLWPANPRFIPEQQGRRRGRRPGPQRKRADAADAGTPVPVDASGDVPPVAEPTRIRDGRRAIHRWGENTHQDSLRQG
ncbi:hypothetical protein Mal15_40870 [Stieleria maiorica]|uniref:HicB family protein n=1 Tax=Stieleria maiorica TaxID=2795974 RepID=A0A5B9MFT2_9BACT|nr:hypothetical protein [Stieleria maiorica]QEG00019.1 hypothetical protein Mal15_40870 [Stieleria maiorica]